MAFTRQGALESGSGGGAWLILLREALLLGEPVLPSASVYRWNFSLRSVDYIAKGLIVEGSNGRVRLHKTPKWVGPFL